MKWSHICSFIFWYKCLLDVHPRINTIFYYDPLVMSKFFGLKMKLMCHLNILSWLNATSNCVHPIVHVENTNSVDIYLEIMRHIEIWIKDIYELDNLKKNGSQVRYIIFLNKYF